MCRSDSRFLVSSPLPDSSKVIADMVLAFNVAFNVGKRLKPMNSLTNMDAAEKVIYLQILDYMERFSEQVIRGFRDPEVKKALAELFEARYPSSDATEPA